MGRRNATIAAANATAVNNALTRREWRILGLLRSTGTQESNLALAVFETTVARGWYVKTHWLREGGLGGKGGAGHEPQDVPTSD
jgi:hypothetical protein